jgi:hypothetical protein
MDAKLKRSCLLFELSMWALVIVVFFTYDC